MERTGLKQLVKRFCPPMLRTPVLRSWRFVRRGLPSAVRHLVDGERVLRTLEEVDLALAQAERAGTHDEAQAAFSRIRFEPAMRFPSDPYSPAYREAQMALYRLIANRSGYDAVECEQLPGDLERDVACPMPYATRSSTHVGEQLMAVGFLMRTLDLKPGQRVLEFGPGHGQTTLQLAMLGQQVTAVDINRQYLDVIGKRAEGLQRRVELVYSDMLDYRAEDPFDRVIFYECFHHCADHVRMLENLKGFVKPDGMVVFAGEPITEAFPLPWGLRLDGQSLYCIRRHGWLELGFHTSYFKQLLRKQGWTCQILDSRDVLWQRVILARRADQRR